MDVKSIFAEEVSYGGCFGTDNSLYNTLDSTNSLESNVPYFISTIEDVSALDINADQYDKIVTVRALHKSIINKDFCFEVAII